MTNRVENDWESTMRRTLFWIVLGSFTMAGCGDSQVQEPAEPEVTEADQEAGKTPSGPDKTARDPLVEGLKEAFTEMAKGIERNNPGFLDQISKNLNFTPLHQAAWDNKTAEARRLLAGGADVNARDTNGSTPLHSAAFAFGADVVAVLLEAGADINARDKNGSTPLHIAMVAAGGGGEKSIPYLLKGKPDINAVDNQGRTPLLYAIQGDNRRLDTVKQLIAAGADVNRCPRDGVAPLHWACRRGADYADVLIAAGADVNAKTEDGETPLHYAAEHGNSRLVQLLLKAKADPNARDNKGWSPMALAADYIHVETASVLRDAGVKEPSWTKLHEAAIFDNKGSVAELVKDKASLNAVDVFGRTPLYWALRCADEEVIDLFVDAGAELKRADKRGMTVLHVAAWADRLDIVKKAVAAGAEVNAADDDGHTALHWAAVSDNEETVRFLLEKGAKGNVVSRSGITPLMLALQSREPEMIKLLVAAGADVLAVNEEGKTVADRLWTIRDAEVKEILRKAIQDATGKQIDKICHLYAADNPQALKADAVEPSTPNLAAVKMYRALFGPDQAEFTGMFVGSVRELATVASLYDATQRYIAFRKELKAAYGPDACKKFNALKVGEMTWTITLLFLDESRYARIEVDVQGDRAVCHRFPELEHCGDVRFVKHGDGWRIDAAFLDPAIQPGENLRLFSALSRCLQKGQALIRVPGNSIEDVKRAMWEEFQRK